MSRTHVCIRMIRTVFGSSFLSLWENARANIAKWRIHLTYARFSILAFYISFQISASLPQCTHFVEESKSIHLLPAKLCNRLQSEKNSDALTVFPKCTGVKIVSKLAVLQENCPSKRVGRIHWWWRRWYKKMFIWFDRMNSQQSKTDFTISQNYFALQEDERTGKITRFTILASNKKEMCKWYTVDSANAVSVDFGRFNFLHLIIHEFLKVCHLFVYVLLVNEWANTMQSIGQTCMGEYKLKSI